MSPSNFAIYDYIVRGIGVYQNEPVEAPITIVYEPHSMLRRMNIRDAMHQALASVPASGHIAFIRSLAQIVDRLADRNSTQFFLSTAGGAETP